MHALVAILAVAAIASGKPQGVTQAIPPPGEAAPAGCSANYAGSFGMAMNPANGMQRRHPPTIPPVWQITDGQVEGQYSSKTAVQMSRPSVQSKSSSRGSPVTPTSRTSTLHRTTMSPSKSGTAYGSHMPVSAPGYSMPTTMQTSSSWSSTLPTSGYMTSVVVSQISDGQVQAPSISWVPVTVNTTKTLVYNPVAMLSDGQVQAATTAHTSLSVSNYVTMVPATASAIAISAPSPATQYGACRSPSTLEMTLANGILTDGHNRTGYIADNRQFQFDAPAQAGAIYTAGWSLCGDGKLALGSQTIFYQCRSGNFYNLYDADWAAQCEPVYFQTYPLSSC